VNSTLYFCRRLQVFISPVVFTPGQLTILRTSPPLTTLSCTFLFPLWSHFYAHPADLAVVISSKGDLFWFAFFCWPPSGRSHTSTFVVKLGSLGTSPFFTPVFFFIGHVGQLPYKSTKELPQRCSFFRLIRSSFRPPLSWFSFLRFKALSRISLCVYCLVDPFFSEDLRSSIFRWLPLFSSCGFFESSRLTITFFSGLVTFPLPLLRHYRRIVTSET